MEGGMMQYPPGDSRMIDKIVHQLKSQGIFDQFRKECIADVDTKPAYQNLHQRVEGSVTGFLASQVWRPDLNKNQLRDSLRKHIHESGFLDIGVERIVDQVVNPKIMSVFMPQVEDVVYKYLGIEKPKKGKENQHVYVATLTQENLARREERKLSTLTDLLPKELEPISPESDTLKEKEDNSVDDGEVGFPDDKEDSSPPFEPIDVNSHLEESSIDSHLSGISELTSHDSQHSHVSFVASNPTNNSSSAKLVLDLSNNDSQLSRVSSGSRLSIVSLGEQNCKLFQNIETNEDSQQSNTSYHFPVLDTEISGSDVIRNKENDFVKDVNFLISRESSSEESTSDSKIHTHVHDDYRSLSDSLLFNSSSKELEKDQEERLDEDSVDVLKKNSYDKSAKICSEKLEMKTEIIGDKPAETENKRVIDKFQTKHYDESVEKVIGEQHERKLQDVSDSKCFGKLDKFIDDRYDRKLNEKSERNLYEKPEKKCEKFELNFNEKLETKCHEKMEIRGDNNIDEKLSRSYLETYEKNAEAKLEEKLELEVEEKLKREKIVEKFEKKLDSKYEKRLYDKSDRKTSHMYDSKLDINLEKNLEDRDSKKFDDKVDRKINEKSSKKLDDKYSKKIDSSYEKKSKEKFERRPDEKLEKKVDDKVDKKCDNRSEKKLEDKQEKTQHKCKEEIDKPREKKSEKKRLNTENKDMKKSDSSSHSSDSDRKKCDKHKKDRGDNWSKLDKSNKLDGKDGKERIEKDNKEKYKHEEKVERDILKEKSKFETKESRDERRTEDKERKGEKDSHKEKLKKNEVDSSKHEKDTRKGDEKRERNGKEKLKSDDKVRLRHDDRYKEKIRTESKDKSDREKNSKYDEKNSKDGSRSNNKDSKDKSKQDIKDKGKEGVNRNDGKKNKKSKHEDRSSTLSEKEGKKIDKKKKDTNYPKSSRTNHKARNNGKKSKEHKGKNVSDDHRLYRDKWSDDRRSTDRDSNGAAHDKSIGNTTSRTSSSETQQSQSRHDKSDGTSSGSNKSDSSGTSESSETSTQLVESSRDADDQTSVNPKSASPSSSLPFKKRPLSIQSDDEQPNNDQPSCIRLAKLFNSKIKKPKIAANIFEVKKIMMLRKSLAKKERKEQKELFKSGKGREGEKDIKSIKKPSNTVLAKRKKLHNNIEKSLHKEANTSLLNRQMPETEHEDDYVPDLKYFESELASSTLSHTDSDFLAYVKQLVENDNISEISTPSDTASEVSDIDDIIQLSDINFDDSVAAELGAKILKSDEGTEIVFDMFPEKNPCRSVSAIESGEFESLPLLEKISVAGEPLQQPIVLINPCDSMLKCNMMERMNSRPSSVLSNWSDRSVDDIVLDHRNMKRNLRRRSSSVTSSNSNKSVCDKMENVPNDVNTSREKETNSKPKRKRLFSRKISRKETGPILKSNTLESTVENRGFRRSRKSNARYSNEMFVSSYNVDDHFMETDDVNYDAFSEERDRILLDESPQQEYPAVAPNNVANSSSGVGKLCFMSVNIPATITEAEDDSSDKELISEPSAGDGYDIMKDNNNVDKGSSEDERGCGDGLLLNQDLILPTLRDLMVESGFRKEDDKSDILPALKTGDTLVTSLLVSGSNVSTSFSQNIRGVYRETEKRRPRLGRSRRVGLGRPPPKETSHQGGDDINVSRTMIPPSANMADFVMPLSPESDVSASSGEVKKTVTDSKVGESQVNSLSSNFEERTISNNQFGDTEIRRSLRSGVGTLGTTSLRGQRYNSDDLYKPRPLFTQGSRRVRGQELALIQESMTNCTAKRHASDVSEVAPVSAKKRR